MARITGTPVYDPLTGTSANDIFYGYGGSDFIYGGRTASARSGDDIFYGGRGDDSMYGGDGRDRFFYEAGGDSMIGGAGIDELSYATARTGIVLYLAEPSEKNSGAAAGDYVGLIERIIGTRFDDTIVTGYENNTELFGGAGNDNLIGTYKAESLHGGAGNDIITGFDTLYPSSGGGADHLFGDGGNDSVYGGINRDLIYGGLGKDALYGGDGNDSLYGQADNDFIAANRGNDSVYGGAGADTFYFSASESGTRHVMDFAAGQGDKLQLDFGGNVSSLAELLPYLSEKDGDLIITMRNDSVGHWLVVVENTTIADLTDQNLIF